jgi:hypothetical protein
VDRAETKILAIVTAKSGENPDHRRGQVSSAMFVSRGLVGPKTYRNSSTPKGKQVNIPVLSNNKLTFLGRLSSVVALSKHRIPWRAVMARSGRMCNGVSQLHPGTREKGVGYPYRELTQVPLAEKAKVCRSKLAKGIRQIGSVTSG